MSICRQRALLLLLTSLFCGISSCRKEKLSPLGANGQSVGKSAHDILSGSKYKSIEIEILYMPGCAPASGSLDNLKSFISGLVNKSGGITITQKQLAASGKSNITLDDIQDIEENNRTSFTSGDKIGISILCVDASYASGANVLGIAYRNTSIALFSKTINANSGSIAQSSRIKLESTVLEHEMGHLLGLVDLGSPMQVAHKDAPHGNHCTNNQCLMYYASETTDILGLLLTGNVPELDVNCKTDLNANKAN